jgi:DNA-binding response OmpR family regulator
MDGMEALRHIREDAGDKKIVCVALSAVGWGHETQRYFEAGFDDFIAKPYRFETVCKRIEKHLGGRFEREAAEPAVADRRRSAPDLSAIRLPEALRRRLLSAARINAFTEIEAVLAELKDMGGREQELAEHLLGLLQRYDSRAIADTVETLLPQLGDQT